MKKPCNKNNTINQFLYFITVTKFDLSHDVASGSEKRHALVVYRLVRNAMTSILRLRKRGQNYKVLTLNVIF